LQPIELWTGKQLFSVLVRPNARTKVLLNLAVKEKIYSKKKEKKEKEEEETMCGRETMCPNDGYVYFGNTKLLSGQVGKTTLGNNCNSKWRSFMYTIPLSGNTVTLSGFFQFFAMRKMVICSMYIIWKVFLLPPFTPSPVYYPYHFAFPIIPVLPCTTHTTYEYHSYHTQKKKSVV
jgi:hypothetical protein